MSMDPDSRATACLAVVQEGPATSAEIGVELGITSKLAGTHMEQLMKRGKVTRTPFLVPNGQAMRSVWLWEAA